MPDQKTLNKSRIIKIKLIMSVRLMTIISEYGGLL